MAGQAHYSPVSSGKGSKMETERIQNWYLMGSIILAMLIIAAVAIPISLAIGIYVARLIIGGV